MVVHAGIAYRAMAMLTDVTVTFVELIEWLIEAANSTFASISTKVWKIRVPILPFGLAYSIVWIGREDLETRWTSNCGWVIEDESEDTLDGSTATKNRPKIPANEMNKYIPRLIVTDGSIRVFELHCRMNFFRGMTVIVSVDIAS
jgi:hypothetical protein